MHETLYNVAEYITVRNAFYLGLISLLIYLVKSSRYKVHPLSKLPGTNGFPFFGNLLSFGKHPEQTLTAWKNVYGDLFYITLGPLRFLVLGSYEVIEEAFVKQKNNFSGRPQFQFFKDLYKGNGILFIDYGEKWKEMHQFGVHTLREYGMGKGSMESKIMDECVHLCKIVQEKALSENGFDLTGDIACAVSNVVCGLVFGRRFDPVHDKEFKILVDNLSTNKYRLIGEIFFLLRTLFPSLSKMYGTGLLVGNIQKRRQLKLEFIKQAIREHEATLDVDHPRDFIDSFLIATRASEKKDLKDEIYSEEQLIAFVRDLFDAGTDTTSNTLRWTLLFLITNPECQEKLHAEIEEVFGLNGIPTIKNLDKCPYTRAVMQEVLRIRPLVPLGMFRRVVETCKINRFDIPENTHVIPNIYAVHHNPDFWGSDHDEFRPDRHLDSKLRFVKSERVITFNIGPRSCIGIQLAKMEYFLFLVSLTQRFKFTFPKSQKPPDLDGFSGFILQPYKYKIVATLR